MPATRVRREENAQICGGSRPFLRRRPARARGENFLCVTRDPGYTEHGQPLVEEARSVGQEMGQRLEEKATQAAPEVRSSAQESAQQRTT